MFEGLLDGCKPGGAIGALRIKASYRPTGGEGTKVAPPTYPLADRYIRDQRYRDGHLQDAVLIDSVQSQANRTEEALRDALDDGRVKLPYLEVAAEIDGLPFRVTSLDAPHRSPDAYFRDAETDEGVAFDSSPVGQALRKATERSARALYQHSPVDLYLGVWDSQRGGRGLRLPRAYTSEMVGFGPSEGKRGAVRTDPYNIPTFEIYQADNDKSNWSVNAGDIKGKAKKTKTSEINHGSVPAKDSPGQFSVSDVERTAVISLKVLRRLRFPDDGNASPDVDAAGRAALAALALLGDRLAFADSTLFLRSSCDLNLTSESAEWVGIGDPVSVALPTVQEAFALFKQAVEHAESLGLKFAEPVQLVPKANLRGLLSLTFASPAAED